MTPADFRTIRRRLGLTQAALGEAMGVSMRSVGGGRRGMYASRNTRRCSWR